MIRAACLTRPTTTLLTVISCAALLYTVSPIVAAAVGPPLGSASRFAVLAGTAVTCTNSTVTGDVGVWPGTAVTNTNCAIDGTVHAADGVAKQAYLDFINAYNNLRDQPPACVSIPGTLDGQFLAPGVYCVTSEAKTGTLTLVAGGAANPQWIFLVDGALTGTLFNVVMDGGEPCDVLWWAEAAATMTDSNFVGTIMAGAAITVTGGAFHGDVLATAAVTLTGTTITDCAAAPQAGHPRGKCNQGVGNGPEACDPGNSNHRHPSNDERGGTPGNPGRKPANRP